MDTLIEVKDSEPSKFDMSVSRSVAAAQEETSDEILKRYGIIDEKGQIIEDDEGTEQNKAAKSQQYDKALKVKDEHVKAQMEPEKVDAEGKKIPKKNILGMDTDGIPNAILGGMADSVQSTFNLGKDVADWALEHAGVNIIDDSFKFQFADKAFPEDDGFANSVIHGISQFLVPFAGISKVTKGVKFGASIAGAASEFIGFEGAENNLADFLQTVPMLQNPVLEYLAGDSKDSEFELRMKNAITGMVSGEAAEWAFKGLMKGFKFMKAQRGLRKADQAYTDAISKRAAGEIPVAQGVEVQPTTVVEASVPTKAELDAAVASGQMTQAEVDAALKKPTIGDVVTKNIPEAQAQTFITKGDSAEDIAFNLNGEVSLSEFTQQVKQMANDPVIEGIEKDSLRMSKLADDAKEYGIDINSIMGKEVGSALNAKEMYVVGRSLVNTTKKFIESADEAFLRGGEENLAKFQQQFANFSALFRTMRMATREWGQTGVVIRDFAKFSDEGQFMMDIVNTYGAENIRKQAFYVSTLAEKNKANVGKLINRAGVGRKMFDVAHEMFVSNILAGVPTQVLNIAANGMHGMFSNIARSVAPIVDNLPLVGGSKKQVGSPEYLQRVFARRNEIMETRASTPFPQRQAMDNELEDLERAIGNFANSGYELGEITSRWMGTIQGIIDVSRIAGKHPSEMFAAGEKAASGNKIEISLKAPALSAENWNLPKDSMAGKALDVFGNIQRTSLNVLRYVDSASKVIAQRSELQAQAARLGVKQNLKGSELDKFIEEFLLNPPRASADAASQFANMVTFTEPLTGAFRNIETAIQTAGVDTVGVPFVKLVQPFFGTIANVAERTIDMGPVGAIGSVIQPMQSRYNKILTAGGVAAQELKARTLLGNTIGMATGALALSGKVTGSGPQNPKDLQEWKDAGNEPNSVKIAGKWVPLNMLGPIGGVMSLYADLAQMMDAAQEEDFDIDWGDVAGLTAFGLWEKGVPDGMFQNWAEVLDTVVSGDTAGLNKKISQIGSNMVPLSGYATNVRKITDPLMRSTTVATDDATPVLKGLVNEIKNKIPGWSSDLPPRRNIMGEKVYYPVGMGQIAGSFFGVKVAKNDFVMKEIVRLGFYQSFKNPTSKNESSFLDLNLPPRTITVSGRPVRLTPKQYDRYQELCVERDGITIKDHLYMEMLDPLYEYEKSDEAKRIFIKSSVEDFRSGAKQRLLEEFPEIELGAAQRQQRRQETIEGLGNAKQSKR